MTAAPCPFCGQPHPTTSAFCPATGRPLHASPAAAPQPPPQQPGYGYPQPPPQQPGHGYQPPPQQPGYGYQQPPQGPPYGYAAPPPQTIGAGKGVGTILTEAFQLYQKHIGVLLLTCAVLLVPISLAKAAALGLILAPTMAVDVAAEHARQVSERTAQDLQRQLKETDPKKRQELARQDQKALQDLQREWAVTGTAAVGGLLAILLGLLAAVVGIVLMYGIAIPLTMGALTVIIADRITGGTAGPGKGFGQVFRRFGKLVSAGIPAFLLVMVGLFLLVIPGLIVGFLFVFVTPVVLLENVGGIAALKRSAALVKANIPQVAVVMLVFAAIRIVTSLTAGLLIPAGAFFVGSLVQDALLMFILPIPILGTVLLYLDIRRQAEGLDERAIRASLDAAG
jgi:uncharacterized membrane protein